MVHFSVSVSLCLYGVFFHISDGNTTEAEKVTEEKGTFCSQFLPLLPSNFRLCFRVCFHNFTLERKRASVPFAALFVSEINNFLFISQLINIFLAREKEKGGGKGARGSCWVTFAGPRAAGLSEPLFHYSHAPFLTCMHTLFVRWILTSQTLNGERRGLIMWC